LLPEHFFLLQHAQQFGLHFQRQFKISSRNIVPPLAA
jgi:hypothetical protein